MGNHSGTPNAPSNPTKPVSPASPKEVTVSVSPKAAGAPAVPKNAAIPAKPSSPKLPGLPGLPSLPKPPTGTNNPASPAKPAPPTAPTGKGIHFGGRRKKRTRKKQHGGGRRHYNKQKEYGPFVEEDFTIGESVIIEDDGGKRKGFISSVQPVGVQLSRRRRNGDYEGLQFYLYDKIESIRRAWKKNNPQGGRGRSRSRKRRNRRRRGAGIFDFFQDTKKKKQTRKEKEEREERNMDARAEQRFKLRLAVAAEEDYLASQNQAGIPNIERMVKMRTAARTAWEHFMTTRNYQKFLYETKWKVNWSGIPPTAEEWSLIRSLKRYDPAGYRAVQQRNFPYPRQRGGKRRKTRKKRHCRHHKRR